MKKLDPKVKGMSLEEKKELLKGELSLINKKFKRDVVTFGYDRVQNRIPFRNPKLNESTGGGVPCGKFSIIWGSKGSCKTTLCYEVVASAQSLGKTSLWVDFERSYSPIWAAAQGVNPDDVIIAPAFEDAESAMDTVISLVKTKAVDVVILDSIQGMSPVGEQHSKKGVEKSMADDTMALIAKKLSQFFRKSSFSVWESDCTFVLIGQTRTDLGGFIAFDKLSGGNALEHWSSFTMNSRRAAKSLWPYVMVDPNVEAAEGDEVEEVEEGGKKSKRIKRYTGFALATRVDKSKVGPDEGKTCNLIFEYGKGIIT